MGYTLDQLQSMGAKPVAAPQSGGKSYTLDQLKTMGAKPVSQSSQPPQSFGQKILGGAKATSDFLNRNVAQPFVNIAAIPVQLGSKLAGGPDPYANGALGGIDVSPVEKVGQKLGSAAEIASYAFPYGTVAKGATSLAKPILGKTLGKLAGNVASGVAGGYGVDVASNLAQGKENVFQPGMGTAIGGAIPVVPKVLGAAGRIAGESLGVSTGTGYGVIKEALAASTQGGERAKAFTDSLRGKVNPEQIVDEARQSLGDVIKQRTQKYAQSLAGLSTRTKKFDTTPVVEKFNSLLEDSGVTFKKNGAPDFSRSPGLGRFAKDFGDISKVLAGWGKKPGDLTITGIDKLKQTIDDFRYGSVDARKFDRFVTILRNEVKTLGKNEPGYQKMLSGYEQSTGLIKEISRGLSLGDKAYTDTAFRKLSSVLRTNNEFRKELLDELNKASGGYLTAKIAGQQLSEYLPRGLARQIEGFGALGAVASGGKPVFLTLLKLAALGSPRVVGELVNALGVSRNVFNGLLDHLGAKTAQFPGDKALQSIPKVLGGGPSTLGKPRSLTSTFTSKTLGGRIKDAVRNYVDNIQPGLSTKDVTGGGAAYNIGLTSVKGSLTTTTDHLATEADELFKKGDFIGAQEKYNQALKDGAENLNSAFKDSGIKIKPKGVGLGLYGAEPEPNYDMTALVPKGKEDLFHYILSDVAENNFHQYSMLTYRQAAHDVPFGVTDAAKGMSHEPAFRFTVQKPLTAEDVSKITEAANKSGIQALSVREGGTVIDTLHLSTYDNDYEKFGQNTIKFEKALNERGIVGQSEYTTQEARHVGSDPSEGHGAVSYKQFRDHFRTQNPGYFNTDQNFTSKVIAKLKNKQSVTKQEVEQLTKSQDVTPMERSVVLNALDDLQGTRFPTDKFAATVEGKSLPITVDESSHYADYGLNNVGLSRYAPDNAEPFGAKTLIFKSPVNHGVGGHFDEPTHIGHSRIYIDEERNFSGTPRPAKDVLEVRKVGEGEDAAYGLFKKAEPTSRGAIDTKNFKTQESAQSYLDILEDQKPSQIIGYGNEFQSDVFQKYSPEDLAIKTMGVDDGQLLKSNINKIQNEYESAARTARTDAQRENLGIADRHGEMSPQTISEQSDVSQKMHKKMVDLSDIRETKMKAAKAEVIRTLSDPHQKQFLHLAKNDRYQDVIFRQTLQKMKEKGVQKARIATPSTVAKIEGFVNEDDMAPYNQENGDRFERGADDLTHGDKIEYAGEDYMVVDTQAQGRGWGGPAPTNIVVAPTDKVRTFSWSEFVDGEADSAWDNAKADIEKVATKGGDITPEAAKQSLDDTAYYDQPGTKELFQNVVGSKQRMSLSEAEDWIRNYAKNEASIDTLEDAYGEDRVFTEQRGENPMIYVVDGDTETLGQPSSYSQNKSADDLACEIDPDMDSTPEEISRMKKVIDDEFDRTQATVLKKQVDLFTNSIKKLAREENLSVNKVDGRYGDSYWYEFPLTNIKRGLFGAIPLLHPSTLGPPDLGSRNTNGTRELPRVPRPLPR